MKSKWKIKGIDNYVFDEYNNLYKLGFKDASGKYQKTKKVLKQYPNRYRIKNDWYSEAVLLKKRFLDPKPIDLINN